MEPYWTKEFSSDGEKFTIKLYQYTPKCIGMTIPEIFGKRLSFAFKDLGGKFNPKLSIGPGWVFRLDKQQDLTEILRKIYKGEIKPEETKFKPPAIEDNDNDMKVFNSLQELIVLLPEEKEERVLAEGEGFRTMVYYNQDNSTVTEGELIYSFSSAHKTMDIYQIVM